MSDRNHGRLMIVLALVVASLALAATACSQPADQEANDSSSAAQADVEQTAANEQAPNQQAEQEAAQDAGEDAAAAPEAGAAGVVALLLPESKTARYETQDRPNFQARLRELCPDCEILYSNADQDAAKQQQQAEAALTNGAQVMVLDPVDSAAAKAIVDRAKEAGVPVVSYDRLILDSDIDYYISFDNERVGQLQAEALLAEMTDQGKADGTIVMINGAPTDNNAGMFKAGAHSVFDESGLTIGREYDTPDWSPNKAQEEMEQAITALGADTIDGVYAANDGTGGGAIAAMKGAGMEPLPPVTGQDAELAAIQRILASEQFMTVYKAIKPEAEAAAELAYALLTGQEPPEGLVTGTIDNGFKEVTVVLLEPIAVTSDNVLDTIIADGFWTVEQVCTEEYAEACAAAGIE